MKINGDFENYILSNFITHVQSAPASSVYYKILNAFEKFILTEVMILKI